MKETLDALGELYRIMEDPAKASRPIVSIGEAIDLPLGDTSSGKYALACRNALVNANSHRRTIHNRLRMTGFAIPQSWTIVDPFGEISIENNSNGTTFSVRYSREPQLDQSRIVAHEIAEVIEQMSAENLTILDPTDKEEYEIRRATFDFGNFAPASVTSVAKAILKGIAGSLEHDSTTMSKAGRPRIHGSDDELKAFWKKFKESGLTRSAFATKEGGDIKRTENKLRSAQNACSKSVQKSVKRK